MKKIPLISLVILLPLRAFAADAGLPFHTGATISVSVTTSASSATTLPIGSQPSWQIELQNTGSSTAFCAFGGSGVVATTSGYPVPSGRDRIITVDEDQKYISCITASSTAMVYATGGVGR